VAPPVTVPTNPAAAGPVDAALLRARWGSLIPSDCEPTLGATYTLFICHYDDERGAYMVDFAAWQDPEMSDYDATHAPDGAAVTAEGTWPAGAVPRGKYVTYDDDSLGPCTEWSYSGTPFSTTVCAEDRAVAAAAVEFLQAHP